MPNVLIRDVPVEDLEQIRSAAVAQGTSLQSYLRTALRSQAAYLRRQAALDATRRRLQGQAAVPEDERVAVLDSIDVAHRQRADELAGRPQE